MTLLTLLAYFWRIILINFIYFYFDRILNLLEVMKFLLLFIIHFCSINYIESAKSYKLTSLESCNADNDAFAEITQCEVDGIYFTFNLHNKALVTKLYVRSHAIDLTGIRI